MVLDGDLLVDRSATTGGGINKGALFHADNLAVQILFAVDRGNANVSHLYRPEHPVVLQVLKSLVDGARAAGKPLSICGEIASDIRLLPVLVGLGLDNLAEAVGMLPEVQACLGRMSVAECKKLADHCLAADSADEVRDLIAEWRDRHPRSPPVKSDARPSVVTS
jgi:phosphoenolpyruvate-protein kinase (PTS system EI component)